MKSTLRTIKHGVEYIVVLGLGKIARILPLRFALAVGSALGRMVWRLGVRRGVTAANLRIAFGEDFPEERIRDIGRKSYEEMGRSAIDFLRMPILADGKWRDYIEVEGREHLEAALSGGHGMVILSGHFGSSEIVTTAVAGMGFPVCLVIGTQKNPWVNEICKDMRRSSGASIIEEKDVARGAFRALRENKCVGFLADQDAGRDGVFVDFFGVPASTPGGGAAFAVRSGAPIVVCAIIREGLKHRLIIEPPAYFQRTGDREKDLREPTQYLTSVLEKYARKFPHMYFWMHKRWKTQPSGRVKDYTYKNIVGG